MSISHDPKKCPVCGEMFVPIRSTKKYCTDECRWEAHNKERLAAVAFLRSLNVDPAGTAK